MPSKSLRQKVDQNFAALNKFKIGFITGVLTSSLLVIGSGHLFFNVFKFGSIRTGSGPSIATGPVDSTGSSSFGSGNQTSGDNNSKDESNEFDVDDLSGIAGLNAGGDITINYSSNAELPGYDESSGFVAPPSDLSRYSAASDLQPDMLISADADKLQFGKNKIVVEGKVYESLFYLTNNVNESRFVFELEGTQKAALLQFALPDAQAGSTSSVSYVVKIAAEGELLWGGEVKRSQGRQILSIPLDIPGAKTLIIEATKTGGDRYSPALMFTKAELLKK